MKIPKRLPIEREEGSHTHYLGKCSDGRLFWAYDTFAFIKSIDETRWWEDPKIERKEYALLHTFDKDGNYLDTTYEIIGPNSETTGKTPNDYLEVLVKTLGTVVYKNIRIKLFETVIDGITFGLIPEEEDELIYLQPSRSVIFGEPWNGVYFNFD